MERTLLIATIATSLLPISRAHHHYIQNAVTGSYWVLLRNTLLVAVRRQVGFQLRVVVLVQMLIELADSLNFHVDFFFQSLSRCQSVQQRVKIQPMCVLAPARQLHSNNNYLNDFMSVLKSPLPPLRSPTNGRGLARQRSPTRPRRRKSLRPMMQLQLSLSSQRQ